MGIFDRFRPRRHNNLPRGQTLSALHLLSYPYQNDTTPSDKQHLQLSSSNLELQPQSSPNTRGRPTSSASWISAMTSTSTSTTTSILTPSSASVSLSISTSTLTSTSNPHSDPLNRPPTPPSRQPPPPSRPSSPPPSPPLFPTTGFSLPLLSPPSHPPPPPPYARLSSRQTDLPLPSYAELVQERQIVPPRPRPVPTPREPSPSFEAAEIEEHEELHGTDPSCWPGCEYCRVYEVWVCYWRGDGEGDVMG